MSLKIVVIDYGIGNVKSIVNALERVGVSPVLSNEKEVILNADGVILPGVGAFSQGMKNLNKYNLVATIHEYAKTNKPLLGICLGMQLLFEGSAEFGDTTGLGLVKGKVVKLAVNGKLTKLPHISWNEITPKEISWNNTILNEIKNKTDMYFVHTYVAEPLDSKVILSTTEYEDVAFCSSIKHNNIYGCQYHPEKSSVNGLRIIENFINICKN